MMEWSLEALGQYFFLFNGEERENDLFHLFCCSSVRICCQSEDETDIPRRTEPRGGAEKWTRTHHWACYESTNYLQLVWFGAFVICSKKHPNRLNSTGILWLGFLFVLRAAIGSELLLKLDCFGSQTLCDCCWSDGDGRRPHAWLWCSLGAARCSHICSPEVTLAGTGTFTS